MSAISVAAWLLSAVAFAAINNGAHCYSMLHGSGGKNNNVHQNSLDDSSTQYGPYFDMSNSKNVTTILGKTTYLNCRVKNLGNKTMTLQVSWVRHRDVHLLTIGRYTYTNDQRFRPIHNAQTDDWTLEIKYPQLRDSGYYECQVSTTPHMSHIVYLDVIEPKTEILGAPDLYINRGSTINLTCVVLLSPEPPAFIFWNHNDAESIPRQCSMAVKPSNQGSTPSSSACVCYFTNRFVKTLLFLPPRVEKRRTRELSPFEIRPFGDTPLT
ncbi:uncharacterized protein LOC107993497 isoform X5 [Apis cerana]|uniref:uncharacterized protein LOC107993497 isoform X5 n=1 Tax=Apis cerana TaxID=7461 RepID=UPI0007E2B1E5|nr:uncharacterized protein LOC107993497 isoform X5 [Apis cerana]